MAWTDEECPEFPQAPVVRCQGIMWPVRSLPPSKPLTGPAPPRRSVCAPEKVAVVMITQTAFRKETPMWLTSVFDSLKSRFSHHPAGQAGRRGAHRPRSHRPRLEPLEGRTLLSTCVVDRLTDASEGTGLMGDLRYCLSRAADGDTIQFGVTGTINLTR